MNINELKILKDKEKMSNEEIAELSGVPVEEVEKIFGEQMENINYMTMLSLEQVLVRKEKIPFRYSKDMGQYCLVSEESVAYNYDARQYGMRDIEMLPEGIWAELIDGKLHFVSAPSRMHQFLVVNILVRIKNHIDKNKRKCHVYTAPLGVVLFEDEVTWVLPDILVACKKDILTDYGCEGAPDLIVEIVSPNNATHDYITKMNKYQQAGVREYWIIDPQAEIVLLHDFENPENSKKYGYEDSIKSNVLDGFEIRIADFIQEFTME